MYVFMCVLAQTLITLQNEQQHAFSWSFSWFPGYFFTILFEIPRFEKMTIYVVQGWLRTPVQDFQSKPWSNRHREQERRHCKPSVQFSAFRYVAGTEGVWELAAFTKLSRQESETTKVHHWRHAHSRWFTRDGKQLVQAHDFYTRTWFENASGCDFSPPWLQRKELAQVSAMGTPAHGVNRKNGITISWNSSIKSNPATIRLFTPRPGSISSDSQSAYSFQSSYWWPITKICWTNRSSSISAEGTGKGHGYPRIRGGEYAEGNEEKHTNSGADNRLSLRLLTRRSVFALCRRWRGQ